MGLGLGPELGYGLALQLESDFLHRGLEVIDHDALHAEVRELLLEEAGEAYARRYDLMRSLRRRDKPLVVLVGGAPGVGKSSLAAELAYRLGLRRVVSSDAVREALRSLIGPELSPSLHRSSYTAWRSDLLPEEQASAKPKRKRVTRGFQSQAQQLATALQAIVERSVAEATSLVLEGIHLVPGLLEFAPQTEAVIVELVLVVEDEARHRRHFASRDEETRQRRGQDAYLEHFEEIRIIHDFIRERARQEGVAVIETGDLEDAVSRAIERVLDAQLSEREDGAPEPLDPSASAPDAPDEV